MCKHSTAENKKFGTQRMNDADNQIFEELVKLLQPFNTEGVELKKETDISADLNIDSVSVLDFIMEVEDSFDIDIPLNLLAETRTMVELVELVKKRQAGE